MSMHEIEDLVHLSIEALDRHFPAGDDRLPDWFTAMYAFQDRYDCSDTRHRVREILVRRGHPGRRRRRVPMIEVAAAVAETGDAELAAGWWALGYEALVDGMPLSVEELAETPGVAELRAFVGRTGAASFVDRPTDDDLDRMGDDLESWWYRTWTEP